MNINFLKLVAISLSVGIFLLIALGAIFFISQRAMAAYGDVSTFVGKLYDGDGGSRVDAYFDFPEDVAIATSGNFFIADTYDNVIRKIDSTGIVSTLAGTGSYGDTDGAVTSAEFALPRGVSFDADSNVYVADTANNKIRKISGDIVSTLVSSGLSGPEGVKVYGSTVYIVDTGNDAIKKISTTGGSVSVVAANLNGPKKIDISDDGNTLYVADAGSYRVLSVNTSTGATSVIAGSGVAGYKEGVGEAAQFRNIWGVTLDSTNNRLFVTDGDGITDVVRKIDLATSTTSLFAEDSAMASLNYGAGLDIYNGYVYVANSGIGTIHKFNINLSGDEEVFAGIERFGNRNGTASVALFGRPYDLVMSHDNAYIYVAENNKIRKIIRTTGVVSQVIGNSVDYYREGDDDPTHGTGPVRFSTIQSITINSAGTRLYVADRWNNRIRGINLEKTLPESYLITGAGYRGVDAQIASGDNGYQEGTKCAEQFNLAVSGCSYFKGPSGIVIDPTDTYLYVTDTGNNRIRKVKISDGQTWLIAGSGVAGFADGTGSVAKFNRPYGITIDSTGKYLYVADSNNHRIRKIDLGTNSVSTLVGSGAAGYREAMGTEAVLSYPEYVKWGDDGMLYFSEAGTQRIRQINPATKLTKLIAGSGERGYKNGSKTTAKFNNPKGLAVYSAGNELYVADTWNDIIRKIDITGEAPFTDPAPTVTGVLPKEVNPAWDKGTGLQVKINGTNFIYGAKAYFADFAAEKNYVQTSTSTAVKLPLSKMKPGWYDVTVINLDGQRATLEKGLGITDSSGKTPATYYEYSQKTAETITNLSAPSIKVASGKSFFAYDSKLRGGYHITAGNVLGDSADEIITGTGNGMAPQVRIFDSGGKAKAQFFAYTSTLRTGVRLTACDVNADGTDEIVTVPGSGSHPQVKIFNAYGQEVASSFYALDGKFQGGAYLACGDIDGNGTKEIVVTAGKGGGAQVMVYDATGKPMANFFAYDKKTFRGGIKVTTADIDADGKDEIVTGPEYGAPHIQIFKIKTNYIQQLSPGFYAFSSSYRGGISVAGVDIDGDGKKEILVGVGDNATPLVKAYNVKEVLQKQFYAYTTNFLGGVNVSGGDVDGDGTDEVLTIPRSSGGPQVKVIEAGSL